MKPSHRTVRFSPAPARLRAAALALVAACAAAGCAAGSYDEFFRALHRDDAGAIRSLLQRGFDPNTVDARGDNGLLIALREPSPGAVQALLASPAIKVEQRNPQDESPLMIAAIKGELDAVKALIAKDADVNKTGWTPLHYAVSAAQPHQLEIVRLLLENSAYIDAESPNRTTPLMMAAAYGTEDATRLLLAEGADPALRNQQGLTAADFARKAERPSLAQLLDAAAAQGRTGTAAPARKAW